MGNDNQGRTLQGTHRTRGVKEITPGIRRDVTVGKGEQQVMQSRSIPRSGQPTWATALSNRLRLLRARWPPGEPQRLRAPRRRAAYDLAAGLGPEAQ
jgi:hypothetical protein